MIEDIIFGLGFVAIVEGLVLALAPLHLKKALFLLVSLPPERLRVLALIFITLGVALIALVRR
jgi:uncharacterized protein YjeT (DUF2065 family)